MIIIRTPLRISIAGGGTDLPAWSKNHEAMFISASINKYIYITLDNASYNKSINLRYSQIEDVENVGEIKHEIIRETFKYFKIKPPLSLTSHADIPAQTGLGSSGSFGVAILHALYPVMLKEELARYSTEIQMNILNYPIGIQDQYIAAYGGIKKFTIKENIEVIPVDYYQLKYKLVMFYTGLKRDTNEVLRKGNTEGLERIQSLAYEIDSELWKGNLDNYGHLLNEHWEYKKKREGITNPKIDEWYELGLKNGALGGKLIGAGGGGFLLFYTNDRESLIKSMPLKHQPFEFDYDGSKVIYKL